MKNKKITKKEWYLKRIKQILEEWIRYEYEYEYDDVEDEELFENFLEYKDNDKKLISFIKTDLVDGLRDDLTCSNGVGGSKCDEQEGMIEFINLFYKLDLKKEYFRIKEVNAIEKEYIWKIMFVYKKEKYEYLSDFFGDFIYENAERILDEIIEKFIN